MSYFYLYLKENYGLGDFIYVDKNVFYRDIEAFINRVYDVAANKGEIFIA
jgi:hypothetical protein